MASVENWAALDPNLDIRVRCQPEDLNTYVEARSSGSGQQADALGANRNSPVG
jgi:hypothetical protein